jgi:opacity protein-like surface antigen
MRRLLLSTAAVAALGMVSVPGASAADIPAPVYKAAPAPLMNWYVEIYGGWTKMRNYNFDFVSVPGGVHFPYTVGFDNGWVVGGAIGRQVINWLRIELDVSHGRNNNSTYVGATPPIFVGTGVTGSMRMTTVTGNAWVSMPLGPLNPYIGGGAGWGRVSGDLTTTNGAGAQYSGSDNGFALVGGAGVRFAAWSNVELDLGYRYRTVRNVSIPSSIAGFTTASSNVATHAVQLGAIFKF